MTTLQLVRDPITCPDWCTESHDPVDGVFSDGYPVHMSTRVEIDSGTDELRGTLVYLAACEYGGKLVTTLVAAPDVDILPSQGPALAAAILKVCALAGVSA